MTEPSPILWGAFTARERGPVVCSPALDRNAIGVSAVAFSVYRAPGIAGGQIDADHRPDYAETRPAVTIGPFPQWSDPARIVTLDPCGHRVAGDFRLDIA